VWLSTRSRRVGTDAPREPSGSLVGNGGTDREGRHEEESRRLLSARRSMTAIKTTERALIVGVRPVLSIV
jgi:hypothetical protein